MDFIINHLYWFWFFVMVIMVAIEALTVSLVSIWCGLSAMVMIFLSLINIPFKWQILIFLSLSLLLIFTTRPVCMKKLHLKDKHTNSDALLGEKMLVMSMITQFHKGTVKAGNGVIWSAESVDKETLNSGTTCVVESIVGNTLLVKKIDKKEK